MAFERVVDKVSPATEKITSDTVFNTADCKTGK